VAAGTTALVGADNSFGEVAGAAYVFARTGSVWSQRQVLSASDAVDGDDYWVSVAISADGTTALIGANRGDLLPYGAEDIGAAYVDKRLSPP